VGGHIQRCPLSVWVRDDRNDGHGDVPDVCHHELPADAATASPMIRRLWSVGRESREYAHLACTTVHLAESRTRISGFTRRRVCARNISSILKFVIRAVLVIGGCRPC
jgi:hypothetical protein